MLKQGFTQHTFCFLAAKKTIYHEQLIPASVAVFSNVPGHNTAPVTHIDEDPRRLVESMIDSLEHMAAAAFDLYSADPVFGPIITAAQLLSLQCKHSAKAFRKAQREYWKTPTDELQSQLKELRFELQCEQRKAQVGDRFLKWCRQLPIFGYNSSKFDWNLIRPYFFPIMMDRDLKTDQRPSVIKKINSYIMVETERLRFLDMMQFLAPNTSYAKFIASQQVHGQKSM
jgi:hypothetical protein